MRKWIRISLVAGIVAAICLLFDAFALFSTFPRWRTIGQPNIAMTSPRYSGFTRDGRRRYELTARSAAQVLSNGERINLNEPIVALEITNGGKFHLQAPTGVFNAKTTVLTMRSEVIGTSGAGHEIYMSQAVVDLSNNTIVSDGTVEIKSGQTMLRGNRLEVVESGHIVILHGSIIRSDNVVYFDRYVVP